MRTVASRSSSSTAAGRVRTAATLVLLFPLVPGCGEETPQAKSEASPRFAALSRLILFRPASGEPRPFFLDRFECTRRDFRDQFAALGKEVPAILVGLWAAGGEAGRDDWPAVGMTALEAQAHARWRFGRLSTYAEWEYAVGGDSNPPYAFPWGQRFEDFRSNTLDLGLLRPAPVGTFEPGRYGSDADSCYDLVGNVAELTLDPGAAAPGSGASTRPGRGWGGLLASFLALNRGIGNQIAIWTGSNGYWERIAPPKPEPRVHAVGAHFRVSVLRPDQLRPDPEWRKVVHGETERSTFVGMRVATDPKTLISLLCACEDPLRPDDEDVLARFLRKHRDLLSPVVAQMPAGQATGAVERCVRQTLR